MTKTNNVKTASVSIDIGEKKVWIIKTKRSGRIAKAAEFDLPDDLKISPDPQYADAIADGIESAAKAAGIRKSKDCVLVVGGSHIIVRRFLWPEMPTEALQLNAETEIAPYLPSEPGFFNISFRILQNIVTGEQETPIRQVEVLVAAMSKDISETLINASKKAGFIPKRIDIRENSRHKLFQIPQLWVSGRKPIKGFDEIFEQPEPFDPGKSFAVLDISDTLLNITVFIDGIFYANRYFGELVTDINTLIAEVSSIIEYIHYKERGSHIKSILIFGSEEKMPELKQLLIENLEVSVYYPQNIMSPNFFESGDKRIRLFVDALGAALYFPEKESVDLDLKPKKSNDGLLARIMMPLLVSISIIGILLIIGLYLPYHTISNLKHKSESLDNELKRYTITANDVASITNEINIMNNTIHEIEEFNKKYPQASRVLYSVYEKLPQGTELSSIVINNGSVRLIGTGTSLNRIASFIIELRAEEMFSEVLSQTAISYENNGSTYVDFEITFILNDL